MTANEAVSAADYDEFAAAYDDANENGLFNAWYERPEMLRLAGDVEGLRVLEAGCGSGPLTKALRDRGAVVSGFDLSQAMVALAKERLGADADVRGRRPGRPTAPRGRSVRPRHRVPRAALRQGLDPTLAELRRVLKPGGRLLVSIIHPFGYAATYRDQDYFARTQYSEDYQFGDTTAVMTYWHRPLQDVLNAFIEAGLRFTSVTEPSAVPETPVELLPPKGQSFICFPFFALESP